MSQLELVVTRPFAEYQRGDRITDQSAAAEILAGEHQHNVVRVAPQPVKE